MRTILILLSFLSAAVHAQDLKIPEATYPTLPEIGKVITDFVPKGWDIEFLETGDLNNDGIDDTVLILHENNPKNIIKNTSFGGEPFNTNPRILVVFFWKNTEGYSLMLENHTLIPRHDDPSLSDVMNGILVSGIEIKRGSLRVKMGVFPLFGSDFSVITYSFRWKNKRFELIGYDRNSQHRVSGATKDVSVNFLTQKIKLTCGNIESNDTGYIKWSKLTQDRVWTIDSIDDGLIFSPEGDLSCQPE